MQSLRELQACFIDYLTEGPAGREPSIHAANPEERKQRLEIYKNAYRIRLRQVIETDHEMLWTYLGDELFGKMVNDYIATHPSHFSSLRNYCDRLPGYLTKTEPFKQHPIIAEIAKFERLLMDAFDAGEGDRADLSQLRALNPQVWPTMQLRFHPSVQLLKTDWNSIESWKALRNDDEPPAASNDVTQHWLLWRDTDRLSQFRPVEAAEQALLAQAISGGAFSSLCETLLNWHTIEQVSVTSLQYVTSWLEQGLVATLVTESDGPFALHAS